MSTATAYIHVPGLIVDCDEFRVGPGVIARLSFAQWQKLDRHFQDSDRKYQQSMPAFWIANIALGDVQDQDQLLAKISALSSRLHEAFLLETRAPRLPTPALSAEYVVLPPHVGLPPVPDRDQAVTLRIFGPLEREWLIFGSDLSYRFNASGLAEVRDWYELLERPESARAFRGVHAGIETLERTARPDSWWGGEQRQHDLSDFVHCIAGCENILLPPAEEREEGTITATFGQHAAALVCGRREQLEAQARLFSDLYRLRSRLIHGRIGSKDLDEEQWQKLPEARVLLRTVIVAALKLGPSYEGQNLWAVLAQAVADANSFDVLCQRRGKLNSL